MMGILDAPILVGPIYSAVGRAEFVPEKERRAQWKQVVQASEDAVQVCRKEEERPSLLEPLNRFETDFINTCDQAIQMIQGRAAVRLSPSTWTRST